MEPSAGAAGATSIEPESLVGTYDLTFGEATPEEG
jgi:hypothetical protein